MKCYVKKNRGSLQNVGREMQCLKRKPTKPSCPTEFIPRTVIFFISESVMMAPPKDDSKDDEPAILQSPEVRVRKEGENFCIEFVFMMTGSNLGTLTLFALSANRGHIRLWQHFGDNGYEWATKKVPLHNQTEDFRLMFVSNQGYSKRAVALSKVEVRPGLCSGESGE